MYLSNITINIKDFFSGNVYLIKQFEIKDETIYIVIVEKLLIVLHIKKCFLKII